MGANNKFSKDSRIKLLSMKDFLEVSNFLLDAKNNLWEDEWEPIGERVFYKFTPKFLMLFCFILSHFTPLPPSSFSYVVLIIYKISLLMLKVCKKSQ